jgi:hypothetical protein
LAEVNVVDMNGLYNTVSNDLNSIMANGDTTILAVGSYKCSEGTCGDPFVLWTIALYGEIKCVEDNASCVLDGENERRLMAVQRTGSGTLILRALTFDKGSGWEGAAYIMDGAKVDLELCTFSNNRMINYGAIQVAHIETSVNVYGTSFSGNIADSGNGADIYNNANAGTITIHNTCPSPYSSNTPIQGKTRMRIA